jgi:bifunctional enzyme CysN/CysC
MTAIACLAGFSAPSVAFRTDRERAAMLLPEGRFLEIFVDTPPEVCRERDTKGLYAKARRGQVANLTGRDQIYEPPTAPALVVRTTEMPADRAAERIVALILERC